MIRFLLRSAPLRDPSRERKGETEGEIREGERGLRRERECRWRVREQKPDSQRDQGERGN